jgi:hypothetical protein
MDCRASTKLTYLESHIQHDLINTKIGEFVDMLNRGEQGYAISESIDFLEKHEELLDDMDQYRPFHCTEEPEASRYMALWFSPKDSLTGLHIDKGEGHLFQLYGTKIVRMFGPDQTKYLYEDDIKIRVYPGFATIIYRISSELKYSIIVEAPFVNNSVLTAECG